MIGSGAARVATARAAGPEAAPSPAPDDDAPPAADPPATGAEPTRAWWDRRRVIVALLAAGWLVGIAWRLWLARALYTPVVLGDESRYMIFARVLAGGPGGYGGDTEATRRVGYALLISPTYWFTSNPYTVYRLVQGL